MFNILRLAKIKTRQKITASVEHIFRLRMQHNIDPKRSNLNKILINELNTDTTKAVDFNQKLTAYYQGLDIKERKDNVLLLQFVVSASPEFFNNKSKKEIDDWSKTQIEFFQKKFDKSLKLAVLHLDEKTPHLHLLVSTEQKTTKTYKNRYGITEKENYSLSARRFNPEYLLELHDQHAEANKKYKLKRGIKGSMRKHKSLKEFYLLVNKALNTDYSKQIENTISSLETSFLSNKVSIEEIREKFKPVINGLLKQNKVLKEKYLFEFQSFAKKLEEKENKLNEKEKQIEEERVTLAARKKLYHEAISRKENIEDLIEENNMLKSMIKTYQTPKTTPDQEEQVVNRQSYKKRF